MKERMPFSMCFRLDHCGKRPQGRILNEARGSKNSQKEKEIANYDAFPIPNGSGEALLIYLLVN